MLYEVITSLDSWAVNLHIIDNSEDGDEYTDHPVTRERILGWKMRTGPVENHSRAACRNGLPLMLQSL